MEGKDNRKRDADQIKRLAASKAVTDNSDSDTFAKVLHRNKASNGFLPTLKNQGKKPPNYKCYESYCVLCNNDGMT